MGAVLVIAAILFKYSLRLYKNFIKKKKVNLLLNE